MHLVDFNLFTLFESSEIISEGDHITFTQGGPLSWRPESKTFSGYASDLRIGTPSKELAVSYQGKTIKFKQTSVDKDGSGEDIYGWNYDSVEGSKFPCKLLIIND
jgi:DUF438 domain-containing protein